MKRDLYRQHWKEGGGTGVTVRMPLAISEKELYRESKSRNQSVARTPSQGTWIQGGKAERISIPVLSSMQVLPSLCFPSHQQLVSSHVLGLPQSLCLLVFSYCHNFNLYIVLIYLGSLFYLIAFLWASSQPWFLLQKTIFSLHLSIPFP